jgi:hypothetical protein
MGDARVAAFEMDKYLNSKPVKRIQDRLKA